LNISNILADLSGSPQPKWEPRLDFLPEGPCPSRLMLVGEAPGEKEVQTRQPFQGASGWLLNDVLKEVGLMRSQAFITNVARERPSGNEIDSWIAWKVRERTPEHKLIDGLSVLPQIVFGRELLHKEVKACKPDVVVAFGNLALWALTGQWGIRKWRSSVMQCKIGDHLFKVIPVMHPAAVLREQPMRRLLVHDLRRAKVELERGPLVRVPPWRFTIRPTFAQAIGFLDDLKARLDRAADQIRLSGDIETRAGHTACLGIATSRHDAICIPFMCVERPTGYWTLDEETEIVWRLQPILAHPKASWTWQNGAYDHQYEYRWHFVLPGLGWDTMLAHHAMFSTDPKALDYLSSLYCDYHRFWKEDGRHWDPSKPEDEYWRYNCEDCVRTFEIREEEEKVIGLLKGDWPELPSVVEFQHRIQPVFVRMMLRGVRSSAEARRQLSREMTTRIAELQAEVDYIVGGPLNINSPAQMKDLFYGVLNLTPVKKRTPEGKTVETCDDEALNTIAARMPVTRPLIKRIQALRSATKFLSTYVEMKPDIDGRYRSSYNVAGTKTYRLSSSENAFGSGGNLQNVPEGDEDDEHDPELIVLPNIRKLFLPDPGKTWFDLDGDSADLRIVTGESGCRQMQAYFAARAKPYVEIAKEFYRDPTITKAHSSYRVMKALCHGSNYGGEPRGLSERIGLPVHEIERIQKWYFGMCPEIKLWQDDIRKQIVGRGWIQNPFGYRLWNWDRPSRKLENEALAWIPQSTVGLFINKIAALIDAELPWVELLLQVHDSLDGQYPTDYPGAVELLKACAQQVTIQCRHELVLIPVGIKTSTVSWGDCK
jgi:DNA polymerase I-like protein with 3'-5' exonuclease and polymerase domains/uracil-DNA glycosylase